MPATTTTTSEVAGPDRSDGPTASGPGAPPPGAAPLRPLRPPRLVVVLLGLLVLPLVVSVGVLIFDVGDRYVPTADLALIEMQVRDVGRHPVLTGLYSRENWNHPGPAQFLLHAPFYWATGGSPVGTFLGALAINAVALVGMVLVAWRRGGTPLALITLLACSLLVRTLGADFVRDPWNCFVTVLPFGLVVFLVWSMWAGDTWALPVAVGVASFVAQAHVSYVALALPLLAWGAAWLVVEVVRRGDREERGRLVRAVVVAAGVAAVMWLPPLIDLVTNSPSNVGKIVAYFGSGDGETHTLVDGWNVVSAQFSTLPEWLTWHRPMTWHSGEPPSLYDPPVPWLLAVAAVAGVVLWRRRPVVGGRLAATFALALALGIVAISRIIGLVLDYRLRWTWILGMVAFVLIAWCGWMVVSGRWRSAGRVLGPLVVVALVALTGVNVVTAARAGVPYEPESEVLGSLLPGVLDAVEGVDGEVLVTDTERGSWYARGVVSELERRGFDARVPEERRELFGDHRVVEADPPAARVHVGIDREVGDLDDDPSLREVSRWSAVDDEEMQATWRRLDEIDADLEAGRITAEEHSLGTVLTNRELHDQSGAIGYVVVLSVDLDPGG